MDNKSGEANKSDKKNIVYQIGDKVKVDGLFQAA